VRLGRGDGGGAQPLVDALAADILGGETLHVDDTPVPVLAAGTGKTKTGRLWTYVRDERPFMGVRPAAALFFFRPTARVSIRRRI
jgi:transposase